MLYAKYKKEALEYLYSLKNYILFSSFIFTTSILIGYAIAQHYPAEIQIVLEKIKEMFLFEEKATQWDIFFFILENNITKLFIILPLGIFAGIIPFFSVFSNGLILGIFSQVISQEASWLFFISGIMPHGIIEIPVLIISSAIGMRIGKVAVYRLFSRKESLKKEFAKALKFFILVLIPLLFIAALIETFITSEILTMIA
jgi:stage II sporulation protein M